MKYQKIEKSPSASTSMPIGHFNRGAGSKKVFYRYTNWGTRITPLDPKDDAVRKADDEIGFQYSMWVDRVLLTPMERITKKPPFERGSTFNPQDCINAVKEVVSKIRRTTIVGPITTTYQGRELFVSCIVESRAVLDIFGDLKLRKYKVVVEFDIVKLK